MDEKMKRSLLCGRKDMLHEAMQNKKLSAPSKVLLFIALKEEFSNEEDIFRNSPEYLMEDKTAVSNALNKLESEGFLLKINCQNWQKQTKAPQYWAFTDIPWHFFINDNISYHFHHKGIKLLWEEIPVHYNIYRVPAVFYQDLLL